MMLIKLKVQSNNLAFKGTTEKFKMRMTEECHIKMTKTVRHVTDYTQNLSINNLQTVIICPRDVATCSKVCNAHRPTSHWQEFLSIVHTTHCLVEVGLLHENNFPRICFSHLIYLRNCLQTDINKKTSNGSQKELEWRIANSIGLL
jgi:hypothetical protein